MSAPEIVRAPENARLMPGGVGSFDVRVYGRPMPSVQWLHAGQPLEQPPERQRSTYQPTTGDARLVLLNLAPTDAGEYRLVARNPAGEVSASAQLMTAEQYDAWLQTQPKPKQPQSVTEELTATLPARAPPAAQVSSAERAVQPEFPVDAFERDLRARKPSLQSVDSDVEREPTAGEGLVRSPPVFVVPLPESLKAAEGTEPVLEALVHSDTRVRVRWYRDGLPIRTPVGARLQASLAELQPEQVAALQVPGATPPLFLAELRLGAVRPADMGWFTLAATNAGGRDVCSGRLAVVPVSEIDESSFVSPDTLQQLENLRSLTTWRSFVLVPPLYTGTLEVLTQVTQHSTLLVTTRASLHVRSRTHLQTAAKS